jgi:molecular chaperone DnaK
MIKDAEINAEEDKKARELIETKNQAEAQVHAVKKDIEEFKSDLSEEDKTKLETACSELEQVINGSDKEQITEKLSSLYAATQPIFDLKAKKESDKEQGETVVDADFKETNNT